MNTEINAPLNFTECGCQSQATREEEGTVILIFEFLSVVAVVGSIRILFDEQINEDDTMEKNGVKLLIDQ